MHQGSWPAFPASALVLSATASCRAVAVCHYQNPHDLQRGGIEKCGPVYGPECKPGAKVYAGKSPHSAISRRTTPCAPRVSIHPGKYWIVTNENGYHYVNQAGRRAPRTGPTQLRRTLRAPDDPGKGLAACCLRAPAASTGSLLSLGSRHVPSPFRAPVAHPPGQRPGRRLPAGPACPRRR
ncbi:exported hypothetical protein [Stenotrophomonas indicatrix]|nr:exported hypothetical protein [Stenotrophomonas indicatrix]